MIASPSPHPCFALIFLSLRSHSLVKQTNQLNGTKLEYIVYWISLMARCRSSGVYACHQVNVCSYMARDAFKGGASHSSKAATPETTNKDLLRMCSNNNKSPSLIHRVQLNWHYLRERKINLAVFPENPPKIDFSWSIPMTDETERETCYAYTVNNSITGKIVSVLSSFIYPHSTRSKLGWPCFCETQNLRNVLAVFFHI